MIRALSIITLCLLILTCSKNPEGITVDTIDSDTIYSKLISKPENLERPLVIVIPGSGGNYMPDKYLFGLVESGYDVLSIAYVGKKKLPKAIELVPLEYLENVVLWSKNRFSKRKIVLLSISKGAEYALTFASHFNLVDGIICYSPSAFVLPNHVTLDKTELQKSSWTFEGKEIPFAALKPFDDKAGMLTYKKYIDPIFSDGKQLNKSRIKVEAIKCNLLLLTGEDDLVWPATKMAHVIQSEIEKSNSSISVNHISYKKCGHQFVWFDKKDPEYKPEYQSMNITGIKKHKFLFGGTKEATIKAMVNSRNAVLDFLNKVEAEQ